MSSTPQEARGIYLEELMYQVFDDFTCCEECECCKETKDPYGTGDSPPSYECTGIPSECIGLEEYL